MEGEAGVVVVFPVSLYISSCPHQPFPITERSLQYVPAYVQNDLILFLESVKGSCIVGDG